MKGSGIEEHSHDAEQGCVPEPCSAVQLQDVVVPRADQTHNAELSSNFVTESSRPSLTTAPLANRNHLSSHWRRNLRPSIESSSFVLRHIEAIDCIRTLKVKHLVFGPLRAWKLHCINHIWRSVTAARTCTTHERSTRCRQSAFTRLISLQQSSHSGASSSSS